MQPEAFDVVVIGAGPGGEACAAHIADAGGRVALVERELVGGECPYWGCMPSKALLRPAQVAAETARTPGVDIAAGDGSPLDAEAVLARRDDVVRHLDDSSHAQRITRHGVTLVRGHGRLDGERRVAVAAAGHDDGERVLEATRAVVIATGSRATVPPIPGLAEAHPWTNREATLARHVPRRLAVIGGGVIGVELAQAWASLGSEVTIVEAAPRLLGREEDRAAELVQSALEQCGVTVRTGCGAARVERDADRVLLHLDDGSRLESDELLVATGRRGNVDDLGLDQVGVQPERGGMIEVDRALRVPGLDWLYAVGDVNGRAQLTHTAVYQAKVVARSALGLETHCVEELFSAPRVVFTDPNVAAVGHTLSSAQEAGIDAIAVDRDPQRTAAGSFTGRGTEGWARLVVDRASGCIVGATFVAHDIADLLQSATIAVVGQVPIERLRHCVAPFPTRSEVWTRLLELIDRDPQLMRRS